MLKKQICAIAVCWVLFQVFAYGDDIVRLQLGEGKSVVGTVTGIDQSGNYILRKNKGGTEHIPYAKVLNVEVLKQKGDADLLTDSPWPEFKRQSDLVGLVLKYIDVLPVGKNNEAVKPFIKAVDFIRDRNVRSAIYELSNALRKEPLWCTALLLRAALWAETDSLDNAQEDVMTVIHLASDLVLSYKLAAEISYRRGLIGQADLFFSMGISKKYSGAEREWRLGHFWLSRDNKKAEAHFNAYKHMDPDLKLTFSVEGILLRQARRAEETGDLDLAGRFYSQLFQGSPLIAGSYRKEFGNLLKRRAKSLSKQGKLEGALEYMKEAAIFLPDEMDRLKREEKILATKALYASLRKIQCFEEVSVVKSQFQEIFDVLPDAAIEKLNNAYGRLCAANLEMGKIDRAIKCLDKMEKRGSELSEKYRILQAIKQKEKTYTASEAAALSESISRVDPGFLAVNGDSLLQSQLDELKRQYLLKRDPNIEKKIVKLEKLFGSSVSIELFKEEIETDIKKNRQSLASVTTGSNGRKKIDNKLLTYFPLEKGRWWTYSSQDGMSEKLRVDEVSRHDYIKARFVCEKLGSKGVLADVAGFGGAVMNIKEVFFTGDKIIANAPSKSEGGELLLWAPLSSIKRKKIFKYKYQQKICSYVSLNEKIRFNGKIFDKCIHVEVCNSLHDPVTGDSRIEIKSHYWYAPDIGLVRFKTEGSVTWNLVDWGKN